MTYIAKAKDESRIALSPPPGQVHEIALYRIFYLAAGRRRSVKRKTLDQALRFQRRLPFGANSEIVPVPKKGPECRLILAAHR